MQKLLETANRLTERLRDGQPERGLEIEPLSVERQIKPCNAIRDGSIQTPEGPSDCHRFQKLSEAVSLQSSKTAQDSHAEKGTCVGCFG